MIGGGPMDCGGMRDMKKNVLLINDMPGYMERQFFAVRMWIRLTCLR